LLSVPLSISVFLSIDLYSLQFLVERIVIFSVHWLLLCIHFTRSYVNAFSDYFFKHLMLIPWLKFKFHHYTCLSFVLYIRYDLVILQLWIFWNLRIYSYLVCIMNNGQTKMCIAVASKCPGHNNVCTLSIMYKSDLSVKSIIICPIMSVCIVRHVCMCSDETDHSLVDSILKVVILPHSMYH